MFVELDPQNFKSITRDMVLINKIKKKISSGNQTGCMHAYSQIYQLKINPNIPAF